MENASKALLIAAEVLIGVLVLSLGVYLFITFSQRYAEVNEQKQQQQLVEFNSTYTRYENRTDLTIYDITTIISNAKQNNKNYIDESNNIDNGEENNIIYITIKKGSTNNIIRKEGNLLIEPDEAEIDTLIKLDQNEIAAGSEAMPTYKCTKINYNEKHRVNKLEFEKN